MKERMLIGVITTECHSEYQGEIMRGLISQAFKASCDIAVICPLTNFLIETTHKFNERSIFNFILSDIFSGFVYDRNSFYNTETQKYIDSLCTRSGKPVMLIDYNDHKRFETTMADDIEAFEMMTDHLIQEHGCRKIYCLTGNKGVLCSEERLKGYLRSMKKHNLHVDKSYYMYGDFWNASAAELAQNIISGKLSKPDAVVCGNDVMASALVENLNNGGIRVPADIAVVGFDATIESYNLPLSITSCKRQNYQLGAEAFRRLYRIITGRICSKVPDEPIEIRLGKSCGCPENLELKRKIRRTLRTSERFQDKLLSSDMLIDIAQTSTLEDVIDRVDHYTYLIYKMAQMYICFTDKFENVIAGKSEDMLDFDISRPVNIAYDKSAVCRNPAPGMCPSASEAVNLFRNSRSHPSAFYLSSLHYNENSFGFIAVTFGKHPITYSRLYLQWVSNLNVAIEKIRMQSMMNIALNKLDSLAVYDDVTGILSKNGLHTYFSSRLKALSAKQKTASFFYIEIPELKNFYMKNSPNKTKSILKEFSEAIKECTTADDLCGTIAPGAFLVISFDNERTDNLIALLKARLSGVSMPDSNISTMFSIGTQSMTLSPDTDIWESIYQASMNVIYTHSRGESNANPQFEKLCELRNKMMKNPEYAWNISEIAESMYISKSYLQKIYKTYFNKSIIEELISFRLDKAKYMLLNTNHTVSSIAAECGYSTYNYFVRQFRTAENMSPSEFRDANPQKNTAE